MALRDRYQAEIQLDTLYEVRFTGLGIEQLQPSIEVIGGTVDIYVSQTNPDGGEPVGMSVIDTAFVGSASFDYIQNYIYITQDTGTTTSIVLSGLQADSGVFFLLLESGSNLLLEDGGRIILE